MSIKLTFFFLSFQVGFMTGPTPMTLHFILVASASCWEVLFCCWQPCLPGIHATSNSPSQLQQPFCTKLPLIPLMFRGILEGTEDCFLIAKFHCGWSEWIFFFFFFYISYSLCTVYVASISCIFFSLFSFFWEVGLFCFTIIHEFWTLWSFWPASEGFLCVKKYDFSADSISSITRQPEETLAILKLVQAAWRDMCVSCQGLNHSLLSASLASK